MKATKIENSIQNSNKLIKRANKKAMKKSFKNSSFSYLPLKSFTHFILVLARATQQHTQKSQKALQIPHPQMNSIINRSFANKFLREKFQSNTKTEQIEIKFTVRYLFDIEKRRNLSSIRPRVRSIKKEEKWESLMTV